MLEFFFFLSSLSLLTPLVEEEDTVEEGAMEEEEEGVMVEEEEGVMVGEEGVMVEVEGAMEEEEAMEGAEVGTFKDHKGSLHQDLASPPVQGYVCPAVCELCVYVCVCEMVYFSLTAAGRQTPVANPCHISPDPVGC